MKVLMLDPSAFTPPYDHHLCEGLATVGCDISLYTTRSDFSKWGSATTYDRVEFFYSRTDAFYKNRDRLPGRIAVKGLEHVINMYQFIREVQSLDPDVIHVQWAPLPIVDRWFFSVLAKVAPLVFTVHDTTPFHGASTSRLQLLGGDSIYEPFDRLIVHTESSRDEIIDRGASPDDVSIVPHGVLEYPGSAAAAGKNGDNRTILFFGTIKPYKNIDMLFEAFAALPVEVRENTDLHIAGTPKMDIEPLRHRATDLGIDSSIRWDLRFVPDAEVPTLFGGADLVVFPYDDIDQSGALLTALQYEIPIVATDIAGFAEVLTDGKHGFLIPPDTPTELASAMNRILTNPDLAARMSENIGELSDAIPSWVEIADRTISVYQEVV